MDNNFLRASGVNHWFDSKRGRKRVLYDISFEIRKGQFTALVGPSGCGKSTLLKMILGTHPPRQGSVTMNGKEIRDPCRDVGIVYQKYSLFPNLTTIDNIAIGPLMDRTTSPKRLIHPLKCRGIHNQAREEARHLLQALRLSDAAQLYPHEMSGGMQQRAAIAQALIMKPQVLLLDEPFGALDTMTREECQRLLLQLYLDNASAADNEKITIIMVTHELSEAVLVSDRVMALSQHWDWKSAGHSSCPGAALVYDRPAPVYAPDAVFKAREFSEQEAEIKKAAFDPSYSQSRDEFNSYWKETIS